MPSARTGEEVDCVGKGARMVWACFLIVLVLSGCAVGPNFRTPKAAVAPEWVEARDNRVSAASADYRGWWKTFNDPVLNGLIDTAFRENLSLQSAGVRVLQARAQLGIAIGQIFPQTQQAIGNVQYNSAGIAASSAGPVASSAGPASSSATASSAGVSLGGSLDYWSSQIGAQASWELDFWGKFRRGIESADASLLSSLADYDSALVTLTADVANDYITIRTAEERIRIARENVVNQQETLKITESRFRHGTVTQLDVEQARTSLLNTQATIPPLITQLRQAQDALSVLLGMPPSTLSDLLGEPPPGIPVSPPQIIVGIPADLLRRRPDVRSAELQAAAQCAQIGVAKAELFPAFSLTGSLVFLSTDLGPSKLSDMFKWGSRSAQAGPTFTWNLFNYGRITNNVRVQDAQFQQLLLNYRNTVLSAQQDVEDNLAAFLQTQDRADLLARSVASAKKAFDLAVSQYREGLKDFTTVLTAQQTLLSQQDSLASTLGNISTSLVGVYRALGGGWEIREGQDLVPPEVRAEMERRTNWGHLLVPSAYNLPASREPRSTPRLPDW